MFELEKNDRIRELIAITKSDSGISGPVLSKAHMELGEYLGSAFLNLDPSDTTVVAVLRGGLFFAEGLYFKLGCKFQTFYPHKQKFVRPDTRNVIIVDSVINTGKTISEILEPDMYVACCVINREAITYFDKQLYTVRVSDNSFVGTDISQQIGGRGPDTTMRLFNQL